MKRLNLYSIVAIDYRMSSIVIPNHWLTIPLSSHAIDSTGFRTALSAEEWKPEDGSVWKETNFEADLKKIEKEAEERLDAKIKELEANVASVGK